jgi:hypothetical protein
MPSSRALATQPLQRLGANAVALLEAAGQVPADLGAQRPQHQDGKRGRADAVGVVVAVHADPLAALDRGQDAVAGGAHVAEQQRVVTRALRLEEGAGGGGVAVAATQQHLSHGAADAQLPGQIQGGRLRAGIDQPSGSAFIHTLMLGRGSDSDAAATTVPRGAILAPERYDGPC